MVRDLQEMIDMLDSHNGQYVNEYFREAGEYRNSVPDHATGLFDKIHKNILFRYYYGDENRCGYGFPIPLKSAFIREKSVDKDAWLKSALEYIFEDSKAQHRPLSFCLITREQKELLDSCLSKYFGKRILWKTNRDDCDYVYLQKSYYQLL